MNENTAWVLIIAILVCGIGSCMCTDTYFREKTKQEYIKQRYVERQVGTLWTERMEWVKAEK